MKELQSAGIIIYRINNNSIEYLLLKYKTGHWDFPKGKLELQESFEQAAHRELMEETGLTAELIPGFKESLAYYFTDLDGLKAHKTVTYFVGKTTNTAVILSHEHTDYIWLIFEQAIRKLTFENAKKILYQADHFLNA